MSLKEYLGCGLEYCYTEIELYFEKNSVQNIESVILPDFIKIYGVEYDSAIEKATKIKNHNLKTIEKFTIQFLKIKIADETLFKIYTLINDFEEILRPSKLSSWEWRQTFYSKINGKSYLCECFKSAIEKESKFSDHPHLKYALRNFSFKNKICHLCTGSNSDLDYCSTMYGSFFKVKYGAYIRKFEIDENLSERDAENKVREIKGVAKIGEKWINETILFNYIKLIFSEYEVLREASPEWIGSQRLDIYIPELRLAIEYQGQQHFKPVNFFGGEEGFIKTQERDKDKLQKCKSNGVCLIYFTFKEQLTEKLVNSRLKNFLEK